MNIQRKSIHFYVPAALIAIVLFAVGILAPMLATTVSAAPGQQQHQGMERQKHHRPALGIWQDQQMVQDLELTKGQVKQLREADFTSREKPLELKAQLDKLSLKMDKAFSDDVVNQKTVLQLAEKIARIKGQLFVQDIESRLSLNNILSAEQMNTLKMISMNQQRKGPERGMKPMPKERAMGGDQPQQGPPPEAYSACEGKAPGDAAEFRSPRGDVIKGACEAQGDRLVLRPDAPPEGRPEGRAPRDYQSN